jgi:hypothetical protein
VTFRKPSDIPRDVSNGASQVPAGVWSGGWRVSGWCIGLFTIQAWASLLLPHHVFDKYRTQEVIRRK